MLILFNKYINQKLVNFVYLMISFWAALTHVKIQYSVISQTFYLFANILMHVTGETVLKVMFSWNAVLWTIKDFLYPPVEII